MSAADMTEPQFRELFNSVSNWGRWHEDGGRGALNHLTPTRIVAAARLVRTGVTVTLGIHLLDYLQFEDLSRHCETHGRWEFLLVVAPLRVHGGTGSPVNPIAVF